MQTYENYWSITNAFTDYNGSKFLDALDLCVKFIDQNKHLPYTNDKYEQLQYAIQAKQGLSLISARKAINQLVKFGFINTHLASYPAETKDYLQAKTNKKRGLLLSKIIYSYSSLNRSVTEYSALHQINFLIKTLTKDVQKAVNSYRLGENFLNTKRKEYLAYHRKNVFEKRFKNAM